MIRFFIGLIFLSQALYASVDIAFIEMKHPLTGKVLVVEPGGSFAHIAISYKKGFWFHSHPLRGVETVSSQQLEEVGQIKALIRLSSEPELSEAFVKGLAGKPYDFAYSWDEEAYYSSELVGKILKLKPEPMKFEAEFWPKTYQSLKNQLGLSPDDIFRLLKKRAGASVITSFR